MQGVFFPNVNAATARVLVAEGCEVVVPPGQGCCGALSTHAGRLDEARRLVRALIERFEQVEVDLVVINSAGCGSHLKDCERLFEGDAFQPRAAAFSKKVRDVNELVASLPPRAVRHPIPARVAYHSPCHLGHAQRLTAPPRALLRAIPGLELVEVPDGDQCCGSAGIYNLVQSASAEQIGARKAEAVQATGARWLASANPGCTLHIQRQLRERGATIRAAQPIEILDASIRGASEPDGGLRAGPGRHGRLGRGQASPGARPAPGESAVPGRRRRGSPNAHERSVAGASPPERPKPATLDPWPSGSGGALQMTGRSRTSVPIGGEKMRYRLMVMLLLLSPLTPAVAQVSVQIGLPSVQIGFNLPSFPQLVVVPGYPVYYDPGSTLNYFFYDGMYWVYEGDHWYASAWYNGPWSMVAPYAVPVFILRVPVHYYRHPPAYFRGWHQDAPPRWGEHWGHDWERQRSGWDQWDRRGVPAPPRCPPTRGSTRGAATRRRRDSTRSTARATGTRRMTMP